MEITINKPKDKNCGVRLTTDVFNVVNTKAAKEGVTVSEVLRAIVNAWAQSQKTN